MAALFTGVVRAPLTGVVLVVEMTDAAVLVLPLPDRDVLLHAARLVEGPAVLAGQHLQDGG
ncbi:chloride channel protein, partial [Streptomyces sp. NPDC048551]|uniref:chloride channel protein n=1 Tax=Streptomyces sp. NPDC048551 TaxID=3155758 RepID=UPI0034122D46